MAKELIAKALPLVRRRFMDISGQHFPQEIAEHELVVYRAKMVFDNTVLGGKSNRSKLSMAAFEALRPDSDSEVKNVVAQAAVTLEMIQAFYLIADDIMDQSETRRGKPTWFKSPGVGYSAINDAFLLDVGSVEILRQLYPAHPQLHRILDAYHRSKKTTVIGQLIDSATERQLKSFTWDRYEQLVQHKTSHYTFFHPLEQALLISDNLKGHEEVRKIAYKIGFLFQAQDDVLDVYGDPEVTGKVGTDLKDAKCTFLTTRAVMKLSSQRLPVLADFEEHFGKPERSSLTIIRQIMDDLRIKDEFVQLQNAMAKKIIDEDLQKLPAELEPLSPVLENLVVRLLNRTK